MKKRMKKNILLLYTFFISAILRANGIDTTFKLPDSIKGTQLLAEVTIKKIKKNTSNYGLRTEAVVLFVRQSSNINEIVFSPTTANTPEETTKGKNTTYNQKNRNIVYSYKFPLNEKHKLLISLANDSATNTAVYSGYVFLASENKWKYIGSHKFTNTWNYIQTPMFYFVKDRKLKSIYLLSQLLLQRNTGSWKNLNLKEDNTPPPIINLYSHIDSLQQRYIEIKQIEDSIAAGKTDATKNHNGIYYTIMKEGTGPQVSVTDTVVAHYKGYLFSDGTIFDQTKDKPATFPLSRLIKGWQIGLPLCKVGGKIKLLIPSGLAYSIRTRAAKIPPNSILVFEIEVVDTRPSQ
jgi:FKBP-type peptidyl-prolyl cis-trans isomerase FkpA